MQKRILLIVASIIVVLGIFAALWFFVLAPGANLAVDPGGAFPGSGDRDPGDTTLDTGPVQGAGTVVAPRLMRITDGPVAKGAVAIYIPPVTVSSSTSTATSTLSEAPADVEVRYVDRKSGNVFSFLVHDRLLTRVSNRTLPGVQEVSWTSDGKLAFARFLTRGTDGEDRIDTYALPATGEEGGYFLEQGIEQVVVRGTSTVFSLLPSTSGSIGTFSAPDGAGSRTVFSSPLSMMRAAFSGGNLVMTSKAAATMDGYAFLVNAADGSFTRLLGPFMGLTSLADPTGAALLFSYVDQGRLYTQVLTIASRTVTPLPLATLSDKCAWSPDGRAVYCAVPTALSKNLPDDWYQGAYAFTDRLWRIDLDTRLATLLVDPNQVAQVTIDAVALTLDSTADVLIFTNKRDGSLWSYDL